VSDDAATKRALARACAAAFLVAAAVLATVILPAEYGLDPLGTGRALGLTALSQPLAPVPVTATSGAALTPTAVGPIGLYPAAFKVDAREIVLGPYEYVEFKYHLEEGATMLFSWTASGEVMHDFHGDREGAAANAAVSYDMSARRQADGSFTAPFRGIHGWFWENPGGDTITVTLTTAGFYSAAHQFHYNGTRLDRAVRALDAIAPVSE
jgi:hypothetical protein